MEKYEPGIIENKWQKIWEEKNFSSPDLDASTSLSTKKPFYNLMMFPYPSAEGLHVGNMYAFTGSDIYGRFKRMQGFSVFEPIGLDGFGIHSENYALKVNRHPLEQAKVSELNFYRQLRATGNAYDWSRALETYNPDYYKWTQWIFIQLFKAGLAYRKRAPVNFCPSCLTVLADEQVIDGKCERCSSIVEKRELEQWFFKITAYADRLLDGLSQIDWSEKVKIAQRQWIGKREGINIRYKIVGSNKEVICWTSRPDTNFGTTFIVLAPEHFLALQITTEDNKEAVESYIKSSKDKSAQERIMEGREKSGAFTGSYAINNLTGEKMPIWISDFVLMEFGTGAVVGVPGHDRRDFEFAKQFGLPIKRVVIGKDGDSSPITKVEQVQEEEGTMVNSGFLNGMDIHQATKKIMDYLEEKGWGKRVTTYHLRDWLISRQRYWGPPIPMIYCETCATNKRSFKTASIRTVVIDGFGEGQMAGWFPVPEEGLPVLLPEVKDWRPKGTGKSPLASVESFVKTKCPKCGGIAHRETDVSDTFLDSAWYFFRYPSTRSGQAPFDPQITKKWLPVDMYIGGAEHSVLHLMYSRFLTMVFKDLGLVEFEEPFKKFYAHGLLMKEGVKMSKSKGNVVIPDAYIQKYGADTLRCYLMFLGPFSQGGDFRDTGIEGMSRFLNKVWKLAISSQDTSDGGRPERSGSHDSSEVKELKRVMHKTIKKVTEDIENLRYNTAIAKLMEWYNDISKRKTQISKQEIETFLLLLAPFAPYMTEELWQKIFARGPVAGFPPASAPSASSVRAVGNPSTHTTPRSIHLQPWPKYDPKMLEEEEVTIVIQVNGKVRDSIRYSALSIKNKEEVEKRARQSDRLKKYLDNKNVKKVIYVPGKIINFVVED